MQKKMKVRTAALAAGVMLLGLAATGCSAKKAEDEAKAKAVAETEAVTIYAVTTTTATRGELKDYLEFSGDVTAKTNVDILPDAAGKITEVRVRVGDLVGKDQIVAYVDASRPGMTYEPGPVKSPISGTITAVNVVPGSMVSQALAVARVSKTESLEISMNVPERYVSKIKLHQDAYLRFDAFPGETFPAKITEISPVLDQTSRTMGVKLSPVAPEARIKAGMFARVKLITDTKANIVKIPATAVVTRSGEDFVFIVQAGDGATVRKQTVTAGIKVDDKIEILFGIAPGEEVVVSGQTLLEDGSSVNIVSRQDPLPAMESSK